MAQEYQQAQKFVQWYKDIIENYRERFFAYVPSNVSLDWFGRLIVGSDKVTVFLKKTPSLEHVIGNIEPRSYISQRNSKPIRKKVPVLKTHDIVSPRKSLLNKKIPASFFDKPGSSSQNFTLKTSLLPSTHVNDNITIEHNEEFCTPEKSTVTFNYPSTVDNEPTQPVKYVAVSGTLNILSDSPTKRIVSKQALKLKIAYSADPFSNEYTVWYIIYETKNKCRKNLLSQFESASKETDSD